MCCTQGLICTHIYKNQNPLTNGTQMGTYAALLHMISDDSESSINLKVLGEHICQHIIGLDPRGIKEGEGVEASQALVNQKFLFDDLVTVGDLLIKSGAKVTTFVRYALGEKKEDVNVWTS